MRNKSMCERDEGERRGGRGGKKLRVEPHVKIAQFYSRKKENLMKHHIDVAPASPIAKRVMTAYIAHGAKRILGVHTRQTFGNVCSMNVSFLQEGQSTSLVTTWPVLYREIHTLRVERFLVTRVGACTCTECLCKVVPKDEKYAHYTPSRVHTQDPFSPKNAPGVSSQTKTSEFWDPLSEQNMNFPIRNWQNVTQTKS